MSGKYSAFDSYEFFGEFFMQENTEGIRFPAKIRYSPQNGLQLEYSISNSSFPSVCDRLFGVLSNGKKCTLVGNFDFESGMHYMGSVFVKSGVHGFLYLIIGDFVDSWQTFECALFTFNGMQEFIHPQGFVTQLKYQEEPIVEVDGDGWNIKVENTATYSMVGNQIINLIYSRDEEATEKLAAALDKIKEEHPTSYFNFRKTLKYYVRYTTDIQQAADRLISDITKISSLFSILMSRPVFPDEITLKLTGKDYTLNVLSSLVLEGRTVELATKEINHRFIPINWKQIDMKIVLSNWLDVYDDFQVLSVSHQYETGFRTLHYAQSDIILYSTQLEAINVDLGGGSSEKYVKPFNVYASSELKSQLVKLFEKTGETDLGRAIASLRNELAHVGRPKVMMKKLNIDDYVYIGQILRLVVISHLFAKLGIHQEQIHQYQGRLSHS
ncbi:HEPN domain-containing protein [Aeromonas hydrophila]|uniref:ApeA N-terminal domain 1-containing protein n=1 Tax=Aeromonas hydrophila TaxID=644 RepID=UPI002442EF2D|nr:HEPN domain-containing protein [Aeromonas hydrophila]